MNITITKEAQFDTNKIILETMERIKEMGIVYDYMFEIVQDKFGEADFNMDSAEVSEVTEKIENIFFNACSMLFQC